MNYEISCWNVDEEQLNKLLRLSHELDLVQNIGICTDAAVFLSKEEIQAKIRAAIETSEVQR